MSTINEVRELVYQTFVTGWGTTTDFTFDNEKFDPPNDASWVRLSVRNTVSNQESLGAVGNRKFQRDAIIFTQIYDLANSSGLLNLDTLGELVRTIFEGKTLSSQAYTTNTLLREVGTEGAWFVLIAETNLTYFDIK